MVELALREQWPFRYNLYMWLLFGEVLVFCS